MLCGVTPITGARCCAVLELRVEGVAGGQIDALQDLAQDLVLHLYYRAGRGLNGERLVVVAVEVLEAGRKRRAKTAAWRRK